MYCHRQYISTLSTAVVYCIVIDNRVQDIRFPNPLSSQLNYFIYYCWAYCPLCGAVVATTMEEVEAHFLNQGICVSPRITLLSLLRVLSATWYAITKRNTVLLDFPAIACWLFPTRTFKRKQTEIECNNLFAIWKFRKRHFNHKQHATWHFLLWAFLFGFPAWPVAAWLLWRRYRRVSGAPTTAVACEMRNLRSHGQLQTDNVQQYKLANQKHLLAVILVILIVGSTAGHVLYRVSYAPKASNRVLFARILRTSTFFLTAAVLNGCRLLRMQWRTRCRLPKRKLPAAATSNRLRSSRSAPPSMVLYLPRKIAIQSGQSRYVLCTKYISSTLQPAPGAFLISCRPECCSFLYCSFLYGSTKRAHFRRGNFLNSSEKVSPSFWSGSFSFVDLNCPISNTPCIRHLVLLIVLNDNLASGINLVLSSTNIEDRLLLVGYYMGFSAVPDPEHRLFA